MIVSPDIGPHISVFGLTQPHLEVGFLIAVFIDFNCLGRALTDAPIVVCKLQGYEL
jgi:hypothetical protein